MATMPLSLLLDISSVENLTLLSSRFTEIAEALLHTQYLRIEHQGVTTDFELLEIEFYLQKPNIHEDPFCHAHEDQQISAQWYFHRAPKQTSSPIRSSNASSTTAQGYRGGTRKGLDLTFGPPVTSSFFPAKESTHCRGGILLRSMRQCNQDAEVISGPSLLVDKILSITESRYISDLVTNKLGGDISALGTTSTAPSNHQSRMYLTSRPHIQNTACPAMHRSPRIGLDLSHPSVSPQFTNCRVVYLAKLYRYFIHPEVLKANGRCHTLLGLYLELILDSTEDPLDYSPALTGSLMKSMNITRATMERYLGDYADGFKNRSLNEYVGTLGKGVCSNPKAFMRLMGVLRRKGLFGRSITTASL